VVFLWKNSLTAVLRWYRIPLYSGRVHTMTSDSSQSSLTIGSLLKKKIRHYAEMLSTKRKTHIRGSFEDPFFYIGTLVVISLFGVVVISSQTLIKILPLQDFSLLRAVAAETLSLQDTFIEPARNFVREFPEVTLVQENSIIGIAAPAMVETATLGIVLDETGAAESREEIIEYRVGKGDTLSSIAEHFGISLNTLLWANDLSQKSVLKLGQKLVILPVSGLVHHVKKGNTVGGIAKLYKGDVRKIVAVNGLSSEDDIFIGDIVIVPGGVMPKRASVAAPTSVPLGSSYFICPNGTCKINQGLHWYNAIDFGGQCGDPIYAAAAGSVQRVKYGWNGGAGNYVNILHPNGVVTTYGHITSSLVSPGRQVSQGDIIAFIGGRPGAPGAGISTGCHVHFGVRGARNPFAK